MAIPTGSCLITKLSGVGPAQYLVGWPPGVVGFYVVFIKTFPSSFIYLFPNIEWETFWLARSFEPHPPLDLNRHMINTAILFKHSYKVPEKYMAGPWNEATTSMPWSPVNQWVKAQHRVCSSSGDHQHSPGSSQDGSGFADEGWGSVELPEERGRKRTYGKI